LPRCRRKWCGLFSPRKDKQRGFSARFRLVPALRGGVAWAATRLIFSMVLPNAADGQAVLKAVSGCALRPPFCPLPAVAAAAGKTKTGRAREEKKKYRRRIQDEEITN